MQELFGCGQHPVVIKKKVGDSCMVIGSWRLPIPSYISAFERFCNENSIWLVDDRDRLMMYHPPDSEKRDVIEYLQMKVLSAENYFTQVCGSG